MKNVEVDGVTYNGVSSVSLRTTSGSYANFIDEDETTQTVVNSVSGKIIHVDDAVTNGVQDLELFDSGGTEITAATTVCIANKNLFRIDLLSASTVSKGITFTKNADGSITANGTSTGTYASASVTLDPAIFQAGQVFTISCGKSTGDLYVQLILNYTDGTTDYLVSRTGPTVFMVPKAVSTVTASVQITASGVTLTNQTIYPQIELAGTPSAFVMNTYSQISYNGSTMPTLPASVANLWTSSSSVASMTMTYTVDVSANADHLQSQNDATTAVMLAKITRPEGGTIGQVLTKIGDDEETWDDVHGLPDGGTNGQVLTHTEDGAAWRTPTIDEITDNSSLPVPSSVLYDAFRDIETDKISKPAGGTTGQVLKKTASGSEWGDAVDSTARASISAETTARQTADTALSGQISALQASVGSPLVASTAAAMEDTTKVYVYTGSETGYTAGNWYYYDGSAWVSGGVYNSVAVQTDATLTGAGVAADAKAAGDGINEVMSQISTISLGIDEDDGLLYIYVNGLKQGEGVEIDSAPKAQVIYNLLNSFSTGGGTATLGSPYLATLSADTGVTIDSVIISMGNADITSSVYNQSNKVINIPSVTGDVSITVSAVTNPDTITLTDVDSSLQEATSNAVESANEADAQCIQFVILTDTHGAANGQKSQNAVRYLLKNSRANKLFWLGDISETNWSSSEYQTFRAPLLNCAEKVYPTIGNHEWFANNAWSNLTEIYTDFLEDKGDALVGNPEHFYFYFDDEPSKTRYIFINTSDGSTEAVTNTQLTWLQTAVQLPSSAWGIVVFSHYSFDNSANHEYSSKSIQIRDILLSTNGEIISHFCGHSHADIQTVLDYSFYEQIIDNDSEPLQSISVVNINRSTGSVYITRIGHGTDIQYNYKNLPTKLEYTITNSLTGCTNTNTSSSIIGGRAYSGTINANQNYEMDSVTVTMEGIDITSTAYDSTTGAVSIASVTGNIVITATAIYLEPITEFTSAGLVASSTPGSWSLTPATFHADMPEVLTFIMKPWEGDAGMPTGFRNGTICRYGLRTTGYTYSYRNIGTPADASSDSALTSVVVNGQRYVYFTITSAMESSAYDLYTADIAGGKIAHTSAVRGYSNTGSGQWTPIDAWVVPYAYSENIIKRLPVHETAEESE